MTKIITIKGNAIIDIYENFDGSFWFITKKCHRQNSVVGGKVYKDDYIFYGYILLADCPGCAGFDYVSKAQLELAGAWKIQRTNWKFCPEVEVVDIPDYFAAGEEPTASLPLNSCSNKCKEVVF